MAITRHLADHFRSNVNRADSILSDRPVCIVDTLNELSGGALPQFLKDLNHESWAGGLVRQEALIALGQDHRAVKGGHGNVRICQPFS